jgi:hypothetical protein
LSSDEGVRGSPQIPRNLKATHMKRISRCLKIKERERERERESQKVGVLAEFIFV